MVNPLPIVVFPTIRTAREFRPVRRRDGLISGGQRKK
jgi:hypothetical protein